MATHAFYFKRDRSIWFISLVVIGIHLIFILSVRFATEKHPFPKPQEKLIVKTIQLNEPKNTIKNPLPFFLPEMVSPEEPVTIQTVQKEETKTLIEKKIEKPAEIEKPIEQPKKPIELETVPTPQAPNVVNKKQEKVAPVKEKPLTKEANKPVKESDKKIEKEKADSTKKTKSLQAPKVEKKQAAKEPVKKESQPQKKSAPKSSMEKSAPKKTNEAAEQAKLKEQEKVKEQESVKAKQRELLAKAQESIAKIDQSRGKIAANKLENTLTSHIPSPISSLHIDTLSSEEGKQLNDYEIGYRDELARRLKLQLRLPEHGEVKIKLTLERSGKVLKVIVMSAQSQANRQYIEKTLPALSFPSFGSNFSGIEQYTFLVSLSNEW